MVDPFMLQNMRDFDGKKFHNLDDPELTLPGRDTQVESQIDDNQLMAIVTGFKDPWRANRRRPSLDRTQKPPGAPRRHQ
jgi:hypothetical protein